MYKFILAAALLSGCTDALVTKLTTIGSSAEVKCYSGEKLIFWGISTGKVSNEENSDGYFAKWKIRRLDGQWNNVEVGNTLAASVSGNCVLIYGN